nr:right-handed parallel beta-helix repeat-containing protein [Bacteroidota bacterium]
MGEAIYIDGKPTISTIRKIGGSANANDKNTFINWKHNIIVNNAGKILIENNVINPLAANRSTVGISKQKCTDVTIKGNAINRTNNGIMLFDNAGATVTVTLNTFNKNLPYDFAKYDDEALYVLKNNLYLKTKIYTITK